MRKSSIQLLLVSALLIALNLVPASAQPPAITWRTPDEDANWVRAEALGGGCDGSGKCSTSLRPGSPTLYEYVGHRSPVARDTRLSSNLSTHGGDPTVVPRQICMVGNQAVGWSAGVWHHGATWSYSIRNGRRVWNGPRMTHWAFEHDDECSLSVPTPTVLPTASQVPTGIPTSSSGGSGIATASTGPTLGPVHPTSTAPPVFPTSDVPIHVPTNSPCEGSIGPDGGLLGRPALELEIPGVTAQIYPIEAIAGPPGPDPIPGQVTAGQSIELVFNLEALRVRNDAFEPDHWGQSWIAFGLYDLTARQTLLEVNTADEKELTDTNGQVIYWNRTLRISEVSIDPRLTFHGPMQFSGFDRLHNGAWSPRDLVPRVNSYVAPHLQPLKISFVPQAGHSYEVWSVAAFDSCRPDYPRWSRARFSAISPALPSPTVVPTPQPPAPPTAQAEFDLLLHSGLDPDNRVYRANSASFSWPAGEILDFMPAVQLQLPTPPDPYYRYQARVTAWSLVGSLGRSALAADDLGRSGCRNRSTPTDASDGLRGCSYRYLEQPGSSDLAGQGHVFWVIGGLPQLDPSVYVYRLEQLQPVDLEIEARILVEVIRASDGIVVAQQVQIVRGLFRIALVVPRDA